MNKGKKGGLSGRPLYDNSNIILKKMYELTNGQIPLIGVGGISSGRDCYEKIKSGASLVQLYTALVYSGPDLINSMKSDLIVHVASLSKTFARSNKFTAFLLLSTSSECVSAERLIGKVPCGC